MDVLPIKNIFKKDKFTFRAAQKKFHEENIF